MKAELIPLWTQNTTVQSNQVQIIFGNRRELTTLSKYLLITPAIFIKNEIMLA